MISCQCNRNRIKPRVQATGICYNKKISDYSTKVSLRASERLAPFNHSWVCVDFISLEANDLEAIERGRTRNGDVGLAYCAHQSTSETSYLSYLFQTPYAGLFLLSLASVLETCECSWPKRESKGAIELESQTRHHPYIMHSAPGYD